MNRLHHIKHTLPKNISDNLSYPTAEFVLLDYNSTDGLGDWVQENMQHYIEAGILKYYRTNDPLYFNRSHSRNMVFQLCEGELICNVDADNYTGHGFAHYINQSFQEDADIFLASTFNEEYLAFKDAYGRFCAWKKDFTAIGGYDEAMNSYGHEDTDLYDRLARLGRKEINMTNKDFLHSISHTDQERTGNEFFRKSLKHFYISYLPGKTRVLFLYHNQRFETGTLVDNYYSIASPCSIEEGDWLTGCWYLNDQTLTLQFDSGTETKLHSDDNFITYKDPVENILLSKVTNKTLLHNTLLSYSIITNSNHIYKNEQKKIITVNHARRFGAGMVQKNFNHTDPITI